MISRGFVVSPHFTIGSSALCYTSYNKGNLTINNGYTQELSPYGTSSALQQKTLFQDLRHLDILPFNPCCLSLMKGLTLEVHISNTQVKTTVFDCFTTNISG